MDFLELSLRIAGRTAGAVYAPVSYAGLSDEERATLDAAFAPHVPAAVDSGFNEWQIQRFTTGGNIHIRRATWDHGKFFATADDVAAFVTSYYTR